MPYLIAIDIGTTSAKALAIDSTGKVLSSHQRFYPTQFGDAGEAEQNPQRIYEAVVELIRAANAFLPGQSVDALVFSAAMHSVMGVDADGNPITPLLIWADTRSVKQAESLRPVAEQLSRQTGTPVHPMSPLCKMMWWREQRKQVFENAFKFISIKEFVVFKLTGLFLVDHSIASATGCFDIEQRVWSTSVLALAGLNVSRFSQPTSVYTMVPLSQSALHMLELRNSIRLILGASDGCCAQLGSDAVHGGDVAITVGTSGAVRMASRYRVVPINGQLFNFILDDETFVVGGATNNGTSLVNWFQQLHPDAATDLTAFVAEAVAVGPGSEGLIMLPYLLGERAPVYDAYARGAFVGISVLHSRLHFQRAVLEAICYSLRDILESILPNGKTVNRIVLSGGITRSADWMQILCDVLQHPLHWLDQPDASAIGAAKIGFRALQWTWSATAPALHCAAPNKELAPVYNRQFAIYQRLYPALQATIKH